MSLYFLLPLVLIGGAGGTGFATAWLLFGAPGQFFNHADQFKISAGLALATPVIAAGCVLTQRLPDLSNWYGSFLQSLSHWAGAAFAIGGAFGAIYSLLIARDLHD
jgi:hypothetical protein